jgi:ADP-ribose pyrophosphatase YjhB (NUDIX family)
MGPDKSAVYRDSSGRALTDYPRPSVAVDTALLTVLPGEAHLSVLQVRRPNAVGWALPGTFLHEGERLIDAVHRSLRAKAGINGTKPRQLHVFDDPDRDDRGWVLSVAHVDVVRAEQLAQREHERTRLIPVHRPGRLPYGHGQIIERAVTQVRARYQAAPDPDRLLTQPFTVLELRHLHQAVTGRPLQRDTFRRQMQPHLIGTGQMSSGTRGRPAELYARRPM